MPAAVMTYASLSDDILGYSERPADARLIDQIPRIILMAESECASDLKVLGNELVVTGTMNAGNPVVEKPSYWRSTTSMTLVTAAGERKPLKKRAYEYLRNYWPDQTQQDEPSFYADYNYNNILVAPTPNAAFEFELIYHARLDPLSESNQTNWTTQTAPQLLLYCAMYHASLFLKNFDKAVVWKGSYDAALNSLGREDARRSVDRTVVKG